MIFKIISVNYNNNFLFFFPAKLREQHNRDLEQVKESYELKIGEKEEV